MLHYLKKFVFVAFHVWYWDQNELNLNKNLDLTLVGSK